VDLHGDRGDPRIARGFLFTIKMTLTLKRRQSAVARAAVYVAIAGQTWLRRIGRDAVGPVVADLALLAVDSGRVFLRGIREQSLSPRTMPRNINLGTLGRVRVESRAAAHKFGN